MTITWKDPDSALSARVVTNNVTDEVTIVTESSGVVMQELDLPIDAFRDLILRWIAEEGP